MNIFTQNNNSFYVVGVSVFAVLLFFVLSNVAEAGGGGGGGGSDPSPGPEPTTQGSTHLGTYQGTNGETYHDTYSHSTHEIRTRCVTCENTGGNRGSRRDPRRPTGPSFVLPSATLRACKSNAAGTGCVGSLTSGTLSLKYNERARFVWSSTGAYNRSNACRIPGFDTTLQRSGSRTAGTRVPPAGQTRTYTLRCNGLFGTSPVTGASNVQIRKYVRPSVSLTANNVGTTNCPSYMTSCAGVDRVITTADDLRLSWSVNNTAALTSCTLRDTDTGRTWAGRPNRSNVDVPEPANDAMKRFTLSCSGPGGSVSRNYTVVTLDPLSTNGGPAVQMDVQPQIVRSGEDTTITWDITPATISGLECSLTKNNSLLQTVTIPSGSRDETLSATATFKITCDANTGSYYRDQESEEIEVKVIPITHET